MPEPNWRAWAGHFQSALLEKPGRTQAEIPDAASVRSFLQEHNLAWGESEFSQAQARARIEKSSLPHRMRETCAAINHEAGRLLVESHYYLPPQPLVNSFTFVQGKAEYTMQLEARAGGPSLVFIVRKWRDRPSSDFVGWVLRLLDRPPCRVQVPCAYEVSEDVAPEQEVRRWFFFLLSGLDRHYAPTLPSRRVSG